MQMTLANKNFIVKVKIEVSYCVRYYKTILFFGCSTGGRSVSPNISLISISAARLICEIGTSLALPSNGFSVLSPTCSNEVNTQEIKTLNGITNHTIFPCNGPVIPALSLSNSPSNPNGSKKQNNFTKKPFMLACCRG